MLRGMKMWKLVAPTTFCSIEIVSTWVVKDCFGFITFVFHPEGTVDVDVVPCLCWDEGCPFHDAGFIFGPKSRWLGHTWWCVDGVTWGRRSWTASGRSQLLSDCFKIVEKTLPTKPGARQWSWWQLCIGMLRKESHWGGRHQRPVMRH